MEKLLPLKDPLSMLELEAERVDEIRTATGASPEIFANFYRPVLKAFAEATQSMPLSPTVFRHAGGAFEFGLIACLVALRYTKSQEFFPEVGSEERRILKPQCLYASFLAALASAVAMVAENVNLCVGADEDEYHPLVTPVSFYQWLRTNPAAHMKWRVAGQPLTPSIKAAIAARFIPQHLLQNFDLRVSFMVYGAIAPQPGGNGFETPLERAIRRTMSTVLEHYAKEDQKRYEPTEKGQSASDHGIAAIADRMVNDTKPIEQIDISKPAPSYQPPPKAPDAAPPPANTVQPLLSSTAYMESLPQHVREWFAAVVSSPTYDTIKTHFVVGEEGVEVPATLLGKFGVAGQTVRAFLTDAKVIIGRSEDGTRFVLDPAVKEYLLKEVSNAS